MITEILRDDCASLAAELAPTLAPLRGRTVLITGAGGFVGSCCLDALAAFGQAAEAGMRLIAVDNFSTGLRARVAHLSRRHDITFLRYDVSRPLPADLRADYIIHLAGIASPAFYRAHPLETIAANVDGTRNVLELARRGCRAMLAFSSSAIYGDPDPACIPTPENYRGNVSCTGPRACYDESKRLTETLCVTYHRLFGVPVNVVRPFNVYGPGQRLDDGRLIPDLMRAALKGGPLVLNSDGQATRSFCYVGDFLHGCLRLLLSPTAGEIFNVGNDEERPIGDVACILAELAAHPPLEIELRVSSDRDYLVDSPNRRCPDLAKLRRTVGWRPRWQLRRGLARTLAHYREAAAAGHLSVA